MKITYLPALTVLLALMTGFSPASRASEAAIRVGSFNVRLLNPNDGPNHWDQRKDHARELIEFYEWDIYGVQEAKAPQIEFLAGTERFAYVGVGREDGAQKGEFSAIFYDTHRFEVLESGTFWLSPTPEEPSKGWDASYKRICTWAKLHDRDQDADFYYFNTHLDNRGEVARREGARLIISRIEELAQGELPVIVTGDFNCQKVDEPYRIMAAKFKDAREVSKAPPYGPTGTFNNFDLDNPLDHQIDFIFVSPGVTVERQAHIADTRDNRYPSDHFPIMAKIRLTGKAADSSGE